MATKNSSGGSSRKKAMVQPPPGGADLPLFASIDLQLKLIKTLRLMKNNRSYTVLEYHQNWALVHFEGDLEPKSITYRDK